MVLKKISKLFKNKKKEETIKVEYQLPDKIKEKIKCDEELKKELVDIYYELNENSRSELLKIIESGDDWKKYKNYIKRKTLVKLINGTISEDDVKKIIKFLKIMTSCKKVFDSVVNNEFKTLLMKIPKKKALSIAKKQGLI